MNQQRAGCSCLKYDGQKNCPPRAVPEQFPFPNDRVDDRVTGNQTSNEGLSSRRAPSLRDFIQHRSGTSLRLIANTEGQIHCGRSRENFAVLRKDLFSKVHAQLFSQGYLDTVSGGLNFVCSEGSLGAAESQGNGHRFFVRRNFFALGIGEEIE